ncbi:MAG: DNA primase [Acidobacteriota bacterium]|nr:MAG: DNA primase [Acidobacteriota bacterium]
MAGGFYPDEFVERVRELADITRIVGDYVPLKKAGARHRALCPFHEERTPSFYVSPAKGLFHCFGCGVGGDVFEFVKLMEHVEFPEALRLVAEKAGVPVPEPIVGRRDGAGGEKISTTEIYEIYDLAQKFYEKNLWEVGLGKIAREYLRERGFGEDAARGIGLGYAPPGWDHLVRFLREGGASTELAERAGLLKASARSEGGFYDVFRGRLLFPVRTPSGRVVAFGGRTLAEDKRGGEESEPKYINSPEHPAFRKRRTLFGLHASRGAIAKKGFAVLVEGYFDWLRLWQEGIQNAVASCGTGFTREHALLLRRYTSKVLVNFDGDAAGRKAAAGALEAMFEGDLAAAVLLFAEGMDPDDFIRTNGREAYLENLRHARPAFDFLVDEVAARHDLKSPHGKVEALNALLPYLARIPSAIERSEYFPRLRDRLSIEDAYLAAEVKRHLRERKGALDRETSASPQASVSLAVTPAERLLLVAAIETPEKASEILSRLFPTPDSPAEGEHDPMHTSGLAPTTSGLACPQTWQAVSRRLAEGREISFAALCEENLSEPEKAFLAALAVEDFSLPEPPEVEGALKTLEDKSLEHQRTLLRQQFKEAERSGDKKRADAIWAQIDVISQKIHQNP